MSLNSATGNNATAQPGEAWFALAVVPRKEKSVARALHAKGYQDFLPLSVERRQWSDRLQDVELPLFPGYVFCRFDPVARLPILKIPAVHSILGHQQAPEPVPDEEIRALRAVCQSGIAATPCPYLAVGSRVHLLEGPLSGIDGILVEATETRLILSISLLQRSVSLAVDRAWIAPVRTYKEYAS